MRTAQRHRFLLALVVAVACALGAVPAATATALTPVVEVDYSTYPTWAITPNVLIGGPADTFQVRNQRNDNPSSYIAVVDGTASVTMNGMSCMSSTDCLVFDAFGTPNVETFTIITPGTLRIVRHLFGGSDVTIGTLTLSSTALAPAPPTGVAAVAGNGSATVSWSAPPTDGGSAITSYTATATPGGASCTTTPPTMSCKVSGLANGTAYTFTVTGTTAVATSGASDPSAAVTPTLPACASNNWSFGVVDYDASGFGDQILVTWNRPTICSGSLTSFAVYQSTTSGGAGTAVNPALCTPAMSGAGVGTETAWSCALKVASLPKSALWFRVVGTTDGGLQPASREVKWERGQAPDADVVSFGTGDCGRGNLVCFIINLVLQTEYASNGNTAITDKQARELLSIGVAFSDTQTARQGRAAKAKWVPIGKKTMKIKKKGKLRVSLPISKRGRALLLKGPLKVRVTYTLSRGTAKRQIVKFVTLPRIAS